MEGNEEVIAFIEVRDGMEWTRPPCALSCASVCRPTRCQPRIGVVAHLPAAPSGKILKARLRELLASAG
ncbi:hypothetical protein ACU4GD_24190 [Cupriavidus basilensis]